MESFQRADDWSLVLFKSMFSFQCWVKMRKERGDAFTFQSWVQRLPRHYSFLDPVSALGMEREGKILELVEFLAWDHMPLIAAPIVDCIPPIVMLCGPLALWANEWPKRENQDDTHLKGGECDVFSYFPFLILLPIGRCPPRFFLAPVAEGCWRWACCFPSLP